MRPGLRAALSLDYPMSLGVYDSYDDAQRAVDYLSDHEFPVQDVLIVGTDLKQLERVTGRLTRGRAIGGGALSGAWLGLFIGIMFALFDPNGFDLVSVVATVAFGSVFGVVWSAAVYRFTSGGQRDFTSVSQVVAAKYEADVAGMRGKFCLHATSLVSGPRGVCKLARLRLMLLRTTLFFL